MYAFHVVQVSRLQMSNYEKFFVYVCGHIDGGSVSTSFALLRGYGEGSPMGRGRTSLDDKQKTTVSVVNDLQRLREGQ